MDYKKFVERLKNQLPNIDKLKELDYSNGEIIDIKNSYILKPKNISKNLFLELGELGELFSRFEIDKLTIGMINFYNEPKNNNNNFELGKVEADYLKYSVEKSLFYVTDNNTILWECSNSPSNFLSALLNIIDYFSKVSIDDSLYDNIQVREGYAKKSSELAGGNQFINFYKMLLGI